MKNILTKIAATILASMFMVGMWLGASSGLPPDLFLASTLVFGSIAISLVIFIWIW